MSADDAGAPRPARLVHHIAGRLRIKVEGARDDEDFLGEVEHVLAALPGVTSVRISAPASSLVVLHEESGADISSQVLDAAQKSGLLDFESPSRQRVPIEVRSDPLIPTDSYGAEIVVACAQLANVVVKAGTGGWVDIKLLLALAAATMSAATARESNRGTPFWLTLAIFAFQSFVSLHTVRPANVPGAVPRSSP